MYMCTVQVNILYMYLFYVSGVNLLIGTENGLMLLDRSGQGKGTDYSVILINIKNLPLR